MQENEDNLAVLHAARDSLKLIQNKFLPTVCSWVQVRLSAWSSAVNLGSKTRQSKDVEGGNTHLGGDEHFSLPLELCPFLEGGLGRGSPGQIRLSGDGLGFTSHALFYSGLPVQGSTVNT